MSISAVTCPGSSSAKFSIFVTFLLLFTGFSDALSTSVCSTIAEELEAAVFGQPGFSGVPMAASAASRLPPRPPASALPSPLVCFFEGVFGGADPPGSGGKLPSSAVQEHGVSGG